MVPDLRLKWFFGDAMSAELSDSARFVICEFL